ncbi:hypothetical protein [Lentzea albida]|uniref:Uncharacterized protein n=1 Tax=Lentzea albida TaxID=65499 RepID=A0A1H9EH57_9PSEU|nr:hypothetical protein [Lentzea albida]SEQ24989.1 hypothetical protein SAMN04488000_102306 [Lentzea albida]
MTRLAIAGRRGLSAAVSAEVDRMVRAVVAGGVRAAPPVADGSLTGVSCLDDGADAVFAQAVLDAGGVLVAVLPASEYREALHEDFRPVYDRMGFRSRSCGRRSPSAEHRGHHDSFATSSARLRTPNLAKSDLRWSCTV